MIFRIKNNDSNLISNLKIYFFLLVSILIYTPSIGQNYTFDVDSIETDSLLLLQLKENIKPDSNELDYNCPCDLIRFTNPEFPGGCKTLSEFLSNNFKYTDSLNKKISNKKIFVEIKVDKHGKISNCKIKKGVNETVDKEILRIFSIMPDWKPGTECKIPIDFLYTIPIRF